VHEIFFNRGKAGTVFDFLEISANTLIESQDVDGFANIGN
jgi:hypothetical protein